MARIIAETAERSAAAVAADRGRCLREDLTDRETGAEAEAARANRPIRQSLVPLLEKQALRQAKATGRVLVVEGCFDVAKLYEAEIHNVVATFGSCLHEGQLPRLDLIAEKTGVQRFRFFYDRDRAGREGMEKARELIGAERQGRYEAEAFDWEVAFPSPPLPAARCRSPMRSRTPASFR